MYLSFYTFLKITIHFTALAILTTNNSTNAGTKNNNNTSRGTNGATSSNKNSNGETTSNKNSNGGTSGGTTGRGLIASLMAVAVDKSSNLEQSFSQLDNQFQNNKC